METKDMGKRLIRQLETIAGKKVIISTPVGLTQQKEYGGNVHQEHKVGWFINDIASLGYDIYLVGIHENNLVRKVKGVNLTLADSHISASAYRVDDVGVIATFKLIDLLLRVPYYLLGLCLPGQRRGHMICVKDLNLID